jgi:hypothetical protein
MSDEKMISKYDRLRSGLQDVALKSKPSTIQDVSFTGTAETFVIVTYRYEEKGGDFVFVECMDDTGLTRICLPPKVANAIARQRDSITSRRRSITAKKLARERKDRGELPGFMRKKN